MIKPDGVQKNLTSEILARFERRGLQIDHIKKMKVSKSLAQKHYAEHSQKDFYRELVDFITSGPVVALVVSGKDAVKRARRIMGATDYRKADPGTIRHDFGSSIMHNVVHGSDSNQRAVQEIRNFFGNNF